MVCESGCDSTRRSVRLHGVAFWVGGMGVSPCCIRTGMSGRDRLQTAIEPGHRSPVQLFCELMVQRLGKAQGSRLRNAVRELIGDEVVIDARGGGVVREFGGDDGFLGVLQDLSQQQGLKLSRCLADLLFLGQLRVPREPFGRNIGRFELSLNRGDVHVTG